MAGGHMSVSWVQFHLASTFCVKKFDNDYILVFEYYDFNYSLNHAQIFRVHSEEPSMILQVVTI